MRYAVYVKGERGISVLEGLKDRKIIPSLCVSEKDDTVISDFCKKAKIPHIVEDHPQKKEHLDLIRRYKFEMIVCAGYSRMLPEALFCDLPFGAINCHGGRLPQYRGASPVPWQIIQGETYGVAYVLKMTNGIDNGPILAEERYEIGEEETARHITDKVASIFKKLIPDVVEAYANNNPPRAVPQSEKDACRWTRRYPDDGLIAWDKFTAKEVVNLIRALDDPYPGAFLVFGGERYIIKKARVYPTKMAGVPGRFVGKTEEGVLVLATDGAVEILKFKKGDACFSGKEFSAQYGETL